MPHRPDRPYMFHQNDIRPAPAMGGNEEWSDLLALIQFAAMVYFP
jgi:hypothetical protein